MVSSSQDQAQPASSIPPDLVASAHECAAASARRAGVVVRSVDDKVDLQAVSQLLAAVWGRTPEGVPVHSEVMRSIVHAGGCTTAAYNYLGELVGGAVLSPGAQPGSTYSLIAAAAPGSADRGIGYAVKLAQRAWALDSDLNTMVWTFDPLVGRNGRFNLAKLGAHAREYDVSFYGQMSDDLNGGDDADRLVATWVLDSAPAIAAAEGTAAELPAPAQGAEALGEGPDGAPMVLRDGTGLWIRVPRDVVLLRAEQPDQACAWRFAVRDAFLPAFADGLVATHVTRQGRYLLTPGGAR